MRKLISLCLLMICLLASTTAFASGGIAGVGVEVFYSKVTDLYERADGMEIGPMTKIGDSYYYFLGKTPADAAKIKLDVTDYGYVDKITVEDSSIITSDKDPIIPFAEAITSAEKAMGLTEDEINVLIDNSKPIGDSNSYIASVWSSSLKKLIYEKITYTDKIVCVIYTE